MNEIAIREVAGEVGLILQNKDHSLWVKELAVTINKLLVEDFDKLVSILYRMDVDELKLRQLLKDNPAVDAGHLIAELMIERQAQKIKSRRRFNQRDNTIDEDEKW